MPVKCKCGEMVAGDTCMLCGESVEHGPGTVMAEPETKYVEATPGQQPEEVGPAEPAKTAPRGDGTRLGRLGGYLLDITRSIQIMDNDGNTIYDIPFGDAECGMRLGALRIKHAGRDISLRGSGSKAWMRAINYLKAKPVWYLRGAEDCDVSYGGTLLGVTPCVVTPPFSWEAFERGSYEVAVSRPGAEPRKRTIRAVSGIHGISYDGGRPAERSAGKPEGETLVLNPDRSLVLSEQPCLTDGRGMVVLRMPGAYAKVAFMKRGATIIWDEPGLGRLSVHIKCDSGLKYDRLREMLPPRAAPAQANAPRVDTTREEPAAEPIPEPAQEAPAQQEPPAEKKESWWSRRRKPKGSKYNRGNFEGTDLCVTSHDLASRLGRFDGYAFEAVMANLLAAMGYKIEKGYEVKSGRMLGPTKSDMGVDVLAVKGKERVIIQCKHWKEQCGGPDVSKTIGAASTNNGTSVLMICTGGFTTQAFQIAKESQMAVELWGWETIRKNIRRYLLK